MKRLKKHGFAFDRQAAGSHEIWYNQQTDLIQLSKIIPVTCLRER
ncbi:MAG: hypothetical protein K8S13_04970 [Desulfobacula sp.]|nr:hypothetical protein [Desulfobacula sp.]